MTGLRRLDHVTSVLAIAGPAHIHPNLFSLQRKKEGMKRGLCISCVTLAFSSTVKANQGTLCRQHI
jgi:hypothetical protein